MDKEKNDGPGCSSGKTLDGMRKNESDCDNGRMLEEMCRRLFDLRSRLQRSAS